MDQEGQPDLAEIIKSQQKIINQIPKLTQRVKFLEEICASNLTIITALSERLERSVNDTRTLAAALTTLKNDVKH